MLLDVEGWIIQQRLRTKWPTSGSWISAGESILARPIILQRSGNFISFQVRGFDDPYFSR
jgi:hypothetical protein